MRLEQDLAQAFYDELGFDEDRESVAACYATKKDVKRFLESDGNFVETEDRFIFPLISENTAKTSSYTGSIEQDIYEERVVNGETVLVNVGERIESPYSGNAMGWRRLAYRATKAI